MILFAFNTHPHHFICIRCAVENRFIICKLFFCSVEHQPCLVPLLRKLNAFPKQRFVSIAFKKEPV